VFWNERKNDAVGGNDDEEEGGRDTARHSIGKVVEQESEIHYDINVIMFAFLFIIKIHEIHNTIQKSEIHYDIYVINYIK
jgi:hypothetical protein